MSKENVLILDNIRSVHNVGGIFMKNLNLLI
jgi:hypothetical protein